MFWQGFNAIDTTKYDIAVTYESGGDAVLPDKKGGWLLVHAVASPGGPSSAIAAVLVWARPKDFGERLAEIHRRLRMGIDSVTHEDIEWLLSRVEGG